MFKLTSLSIGLLTFFTFLNTQAQSVTKKVLFLGNSYTYVNNLPQIVADVATSMGDTLIFDSNTPGGYSLSGHLTDSISQSKIAEGHWDYIVLQEQSQMPAMQNYSNFFNGAHQLCNYINLYNPCARTMFYMTWGREQGDSFYCASWPPVCTYEGMDSLLHLRYMEIALYNNADVSPVGAVWRYVRQNYPGIVLYQSDGSHPSVAGSYIAACCFYTALFKKDPTLITYNCTLSQSDAAVIRNATKILVYDSLQNWNFENYLPIADFNYTIGSGINQVNFINNSRHSKNYLWDFGDGSTSTDENPIHNYLLDGSYLITLTVTNCDSVEIHQSIVQKYITFCSYTPTIFPENLIVCSTDTLWTQTYDAYQWYDSNGNPIPGATNQYLIVSSDAMLNNGGLKFSVLTTKNNCSEMSQQVFAAKYNIDFYITEGFPFVLDTFCSGDTLKIFLVLSSQVQNHSIQWLNNGTPVLSANTDTLVVTSSGKYAASVIDSACSGMTFISSPFNLTFINCNSGIIENKTQPKVLVYPNPADGFINVKVNSELIGTDYAIIDILGKIIRTGKFENEINNLKINDINSGIYMLQIGKTNKQNIKLIKL